MLIEGTRCETVRGLMEQFRVGQRTIQRWKHRDGFPAPLGRVGDGAHIYEWSAVKQWAIDSGMWDEIVDMPLPVRKGWRVQQ